MKVSTIFECDDLPDLLDAVIDHYVYELSYGTLTARLDNLDKKCGISQPLPPEVLSKLEKYTRFRNLLIHDVASFRYATLGKPGQIRVTTREDKPIVEWETAEDSADTCLKAV